MKSKNYHSNRILELRINDWSKGKFFVGLLIIAFICQLLGRFKSKRRIFAKYALVKKRFEIQWALDITIILGCDLEL